VGKNIYQGNSELDIMWRPNFYTKVRELLLLAYTSNWKSYHSYWRTLF